MSAELRVETEMENPASSATAGCLIVNADDWGRDRATTDRIRECLAAKALSSASAMVFMADSERAAEIARQLDFDCGLHLNLTTPFSAGCPARVAEHQQRIAHYLRRHRFAPVFFHPGLANSFQYVVAAQLDEYRRLYGVEPGRIDGHHHMHLSANVLVQGLIPEGTIVRRNFSFQPGEKSHANRFYRKFVDRCLQRKYRLADFLFNLQPLDSASRLQRIVSEARQSIVELETHPIDADEYRFLMSGGLSALDNDVRIAPRFSLPPGATNPAPHLAPNVNRAASSGN